MHNFLTICIVYNSIDSLSDCNDWMERPDYIHTSYFYHRSCSNYNSKAAEIR